MSSNVLQFPNQKLQNLYQSLPKLDWNPKFLGSTGYIDNVQAKDLNESIMSCIDKFGRPFISFKYATRQKSWELDGEIYQLDDNKVHCLTIFQRYINEPRKWCKSGYASSSPKSPIFYGQSTLLDSEMINYLVDFLLHLQTNNIVNIPYTDYVNNLLSPKSVKCQLT